MMSKNFDIIQKTTGVVTALYLFLVGIAGMSSEIKHMGSGFAETVLTTTSNPFIALFIGVFATVLFQSSSTTTSLIVGMVSSGTLTISSSIPMVMGANIGTSVTNTIVSLGSYTNKENYRRAFAGATVHDLFNFLTVLVLLPIQWASNFLGEITWEFAKNEVPCEGDCKKWEGPIKKIVKPVVSKILKIDKKVSKYIYQGYCDGYCDYDCSSEDQTQMTNLMCDNYNYDSCNDLPNFKDSWLSSNVLKCKRFPQYFKSEVTATDTAISYYYECPNGQDCSNAIPWNSTITTLTNNIYDVCSADWESKPCDKPVLKGGLLYDWGMNDQGAGVLAVSFSVVSLFCSLFS